MESATRMESTTPPLPLWCMVMVAAKYIGLWGQISSSFSWRARYACWGGREKGQQEMWREKGQQEI